MSGSNAANLPVAFKLEGIEQVQRTLRETTQQFVEQARAASTVGPAVSSAAEAFQRLEQRAAGARGVVNDLRGAMELIGAGGAAGFLGPASSTIGNVADLLGTASVAAGRFGTALATIGTAAATTAGLVALPALLQQIGLGINSVGMTTQQTAEHQVAWKRTLDEINDRLLTQEERANKAAAAIRNVAIAQRESQLGAEAEVRGTNLGRLADIDAGTLPRAQRGVDDARRAVAAADSGLATAESDAAASRIPGLLSNRVAAARASASSAAEALRRAEAELARVQEDRRVTIADIDRRTTEIQTVQADTDRLRAIQYASPIGPEQPRATGGAGRGGGRAEDPDAAFERSEALARRTAQAAIDANQRAQDRIADQQQQATERFERQSIDAFARIGENAADRIGTGLVQGFLTGQGAAVNFGNLLNSILASALSDLAKLAIINPASNAVFGTSRPTLDGAIGGLGGGGGGGLGGISDIFSLGSSAYSLAGGGGGGGLLSTIGGYLGFGGTAAAAPASSGVLVGANGMLTGGGATSLAPAATGSLGAFGGFAGGIGGGYLIGSTVGGMLAGNSPARQMNAQIGSGGGALAGAGIGFLIGGPVGALVGGLAGGAGGGALGGIIGPGAPSIGGDVLVSVDGSGKLVVGRSAGKGFDTGALSQQVRTDADALNARLGSAGLRFDSNEAGGWLPDIGWVGGGGSANPASLSDLLARGGATLKASDARGQSVLDRYGGGNNIEQALALAGEMQQFSSALDQLKASATQATDPIGQIRAQFDSLRATAERLGFGLDEVNAAQERAIGQYRDQVAGGLVGTVGGITAYARGLRTANDNSGNPMSRLSAAESSFFGDAGAALNGNMDALGRITNSAETFRTLSRAVYGTGQGYAATEARIAETLGRIGAIGAEQLTASAMDAITARQTDVLASGQALLVEEVRKLRDELRQMQTNPLTARAA
jgi:hypothetical protein